MERRTPEAGRRKRSVGVMVLLILSLTVNAGVLGFLGVRRYQESRRLKAATAKYMRRPDAYRIFDRLGRQYSHTQDTLLRGYWAARHELGRLALAPAADSARVESLLSEVERVELGFLSAHEGLTDSLQALLNDKEQALFRRLARQAADSVHRVDSLAAAKRGGR